MPLRDLFIAVRDHTRDQHLAYQANTKTLAWRIADVVSRTWDLGFTSFGGPAVHFGLLHRRFVEGSGGKAPWVDEQTYQELFALCQALPGPASTKMVFFLALLHAGLVPAIVAFMLWSLPGAIGMYGLSLGVQRMDDLLPEAVYALLSGLNASTVGIIALAAVQLAEKAIKDRLTRILVIFGACAGLCYNSLWYFPLLIAIGGVATPLWDCYLKQKINKLRVKWTRKRGGDPQAAAEESALQESVSPHERLSRDSVVQRRFTTASPRSGSPAQVSSQQPTTEVGFNSYEHGEDVAAPMDIISHAISLRWGLSIIGCFFATFAAIIAIRAILDSPPLAVDLFSNMYLAGTIIFGGGPVVIPLLRSYVVDPGWVSSRNFLIGLAIIQAFPGPNFNFGVYLGALAVLHIQPTAVGALLGFVGIFLPGLLLAIGSQSLWRVLRTKAVIISVLRGVNATAVGLVFTAVYRLWEMGYLTPEESNGKSIASEPFWVVVAAVTYAESAWFNVPAPLAIVFGAVLGLCWYGTVGR